MPSVPPQPNQGRSRALSPTSTDFRELLETAQNVRKSAHAEATRGHSESFGIGRAPLRHDVAERACAKRQILKATYCRLRSETSVRSRAPLCQQSKRRRPARRTVRLRRLKSFKGHNENRVASIDWIDGSPRVASREFGFQHSSSRNFRRPAEHDQCILAPHVAASRCNPSHRAVSSSSVCCTLDMSFVRATVLGARVLASMPRTQGELLTRRTFSNFAWSLRSDGLMWDSARGQYLAWLCKRTESLEHRAMQLSQRVRGPASGCASIVSRY